MWNAPPLCGKQKRQASADFLGVTAFLGNVVTKCCIPTTIFGRSNCRQSDFLNPGKEQIAGQTALPAESAQAKKAAAEDAAALIRSDCRRSRYLSSSPPKDEGLDELWSPECPHDGAGFDGAGLGVAQLEVDAGGDGSAAGATGFGAAGLAARTAFLS